MLKIEHLDKRLGQKDVLKDLNLEVGNGSIFGLVGVNGAGKSTLLRCISGVYQPDGGRILLDDRDTWQDPSVRGEIAFVADEACFPQGSTIRSRKAFYQDLYPSYDEEAFQKYLKLFELDENQSISSLSKGNKRRTALTYALALKPRLLLLDEAYDGLEPLARYHFKKALTDLLEDEQISVIISSHNLKELEDICDSFGILDEGRIVSYGDLLESKEEINKYQLAFKDQKSPADFRDFDLLHYDNEGQVYTLVIRGSVEETEQKLQAMKPLLLNVLPVNFEELFIYEMESREEKKDHE